MGQHSPDHAFRMVEAPAQQEQFRPQARMRGKLRVMVKLRERLAIKSFHKPQCK